jgi:hypothetical protein
VRHYIPSKRLLIKINLLNFYIIHRSWAKKYVGESKIIRPIGTCFAVGYTAGWA